MVLAVDLYNGKVAKEATEARTLTSSLNKEIAIQNMKAAASYLREPGAVKMASDMPLPIRKEFALKEKMLIFRFRNGVSSLLDKSSQNDTIIVYE